MADKTLDLFMNDPIEYFDHSITKMHGIARAELSTLQREAMADIRVKGDYRGCEVVWYTQEFRAESARARSWPNRDRAGTGRPGRAGCVRSWTSRKRVIETWV